MIEGMQPIDERYVIASLEDAGRTLLAMRFPKNGAPPLSARSGHPDVIHEVIEAYGWDRDIVVRAAIPSRRQISAMDDTLEWLSFITNPVRHKLVFARALVHPVSDRHIYSWRKLGTALGFDHKAAQRWHRYGIDDITRGLATKYCAGPCPGRPTVIGVFA